MAPRETPCWWSRAPLALVTWGLLFLFIGAAMAEPGDAVTSRPPLSLRDAAFGPSAANGTIQGLTEDETARPLPAATVRLFGAVDRSTTTNATGAFAFADVPPGLYLIAASKAGYLNASGQAEAFSGLATNVTLRLYGGGIAGTVRDSQGALRGANVTVLGAGTSVLSDANGNYLIRGLPTNDYAVFVNKDGYQNATRLAHVEAGVTTDNVDFLLESLLGAIAGFVVTEEGDPLAGANVTVLLATGTLVDTTDGLGAYLVSGVPRGNWTVEATKKGYWPNATAAVVVERGATTGPVNFTLQRKLGILRGNITDGTNAIPGASVSVVGETVLNTTTTSRGTYVVNDIPPGAYFIFVQKAGFGNALSSTLIIGLGDELYVDFVLRPREGILNGTVTDGSVPISGARILIEGPGLSATEFTNDAGFFQRGGIPNGTYTVTVSAEGFRSYTISVRISVDQPVTLGLVALRPVTAITPTPGFFLEFDLPHSLMVIGFLATILVFALATFLRLRMFVRPHAAPVEYEEEGGPETPAEEGSSEGSSFGRPPPDE